MSWLFGMNQRPEDFSQFVPPASTVGGGGLDGSGDLGDGKRKSSAMEAYRFDSAALERADKAAKDLESSISDTGSYEVDGTSERAHQPDQDDVGP
nr:ATPase family AAA domain-containing protein 3A homolog [Cherax quadricarinatus]